MRELLLAAAAATMLTGCASIIKGSDQSMSFRSVPEAAKVSITNRAGQTIHTGEAPLTVQLKRGAGYFKAESYKVRFEKDGFKTNEIQVTAKVNGWYIGNLIFGGLIGMLIVDPITGAMYTLTPDEVSTTLDALKVETRQGTRSLTVVLVEDVPAGVLASARRVM